MSPAAGRDDADRTLAELPLLQLMSGDVRALVAASFERVTFGFGAEIVREGEPADAFYVLVSGTARVVKRGDDGEEVQLNTLGPGATFGEIALLADTARSATVRAREPVEALRLDRSVFSGLLRSHPEVRRHLELAAASIELQNFLRLHSLFARLPADVLALVARELRPVAAPTGDLVIREGDPAGAMFVVREGRLRAVRGSEDRGYLRRGDVFGERAVLAGEPREASVEALTDCELLALDADALKRLLDEQPAFRASLQELVAGYEYRTLARVPLDFAEEILPAQAVAATAPTPGPGATAAPDMEGVEEVAAADPDLAAPSKKPIKRFPHLTQVDEMDCGAAALAMVCRHFGRRVSLTRVRSAVNTSTDGTSLLGLTKGAEQLGLAARAVKASKSNLDALGLPAIVHWEGNHWMVLYRVERGRVRVADPASGLRRIDRAEFERDWSGFAALVEPTPALEQTPEEESPLRWIGPLFRPYRRTFAVALGLGLVAAALQMLIPVFSQVIIDDAVADNDRSLLTLIVLGMLGVIAVSVLAQLVQRYMLSKAAVKIDGETLDHVSERLLGLPMSYFHARRTGDIERRLAGLRQVRVFAVQSGVQGITALTQIVAAVALMFVYSWSLALVYLAALPFYAALMRYSRRRLRPLFDALEEAHGRYHSSQIDAIKGIETVKSMSAEPALRGTLRAQFDRLARKVFRADLAIMGYDGAIQTATFLSLAAFLWVGALQVMSGDLTIGELVSFNSLVLLANAPIAIMLLLWDELQLASVLLNRLQDVVEQEPEQGDDRSGLAAVPTLEGRVELRGVGFHYPGPIEVPILQDVTLDVAPGTSVALVGRSGSGKTTFAKLLAGLIAPTAGEIRFDGVDQRTLDHRELRRQIGFVLQDPYLFDDTIARNIAFGSGQPDAERVMWAARAANAHEFIERLPLGYETRVGERGLLVSGGQQQRIAIARAVYNQPPVLILDEATSSLDTESERAVQQNMSQMLAGRTSFVIAHRLSTVRDADLIVVLEKGRIVEQGSHDELVARRGLYYYLVSQQLGGQ